MKHAPNKFLITAIFVTIFSSVFAQINPLAIGTIHANDSVVIIYDVTINDPLPMGVVKIGNQATLSGNFTSIVSDDPDTPAASDSTFTLVINTLPVTLLDFNVLKQKTSVLVKWSTSQELNSKNFEVQHSTDGINFRPIGSVPAAGNSNIKKDYSFLHGTPVKGINYYRLKQYDLDGHAVIYYIRTVNFGNNEVQDIYIYPNPVTQGTITIQPTKIEKGTYTISLYNNAGEKMLEQRIIYNGNGIPVTVSLPKVLAAGAYTLKVQNSEVKLSQVILIQ